MLFSYIFYISSLFFSVALAYWADKYNSRLLRNMLIGYWVIMTGFRGYEVGIDTGNYVEMWYTTLIGAPVYCEIGFQWLMQLLQRYSQSPTILFVICSIITFGLLIVRLWDFRKIASFSMMIAVLYMLVVLPSMNTMRQFCAISIVFFCTRYLFRKQYLKFLLGIVGASFLHTSSLLGILFIGFELLEWKQFTFKKKVCYVILILTGLFLSGLAYDLVYSEYGHYFENETVKPGILTTGLFLFITFAYVTSNLNKKRCITFCAIDKSHFLIQVSFVAYIIAIILQSLGYFFQYMDRIGLIYSIWGVVFWGILFKLTKRRSLTILFFMAMLLFVAYPFILILTSNSLKVLPYSICW